MEGKLNNKMKVYKFYPILYIVLIVFCCITFFIQHSQFSNAASNIVCTAIYSPVCGIDGKTYSNSCVATEQNNVPIAYTGECKVCQPRPACLDSTPQCLISEPIGGWCPTPTGELKGDLNKDGIVNSLDWSIMNSKWFTNDSNADLNSDGLVNSLDFSIMNGDWFKSVTVGTKVSLKEGERAGPFLLQKIYSDYVTGLNFREYPIATDQGSPVTLRIGESVSNGCTITLTLNAIQGNVAIFTMVTDNSRPCPICLAKNTLIDTINGPLKVQDIQMGMPIWTVNSSGQRISGMVTKISKVFVPSTHQVTHLKLEDGRELFVSSGHSTIDGRTVGDLYKGEFYDGARIFSIEKVNYSDDATYDILPSGETGFYWANEIILKSTLY